MKKVFISYSHDSEEHCERVLALSERLRADGIETSIDQYLNGTPEGGWPRWMLDKLDAADSVLVVCTEPYYRRFRGHEKPGIGKGADWEGTLITQEIYDSKSRSLKFVPVFLSPVVADWIPEPLRSATHYTLTSESAYQSLYDFLLGQAHVEPGAIGTLRARAPKKGAPLTFAPEARPSQPIPPAHSSAPAARAQVIKVLIVSASPKDKAALGVDVEIREIKKAVKAARYRELFSIEAETAMLAADFAHSVNEHAPQILHYSGFHSGPGGIVLLDHESRSKPVSPAALQHVLGRQPGLRMVVLNTCHSLTTANVLVQKIDFAIGVEEEVDDRAATEFARSLYAALADGHPVQSAYDQAVTHMIGSWDEKSIPQLCTKAGVNPAEFAFIGETFPNAVSPVEAAHPHDHESGALKTWRRKLEYLRQQEAIATDPAQKFALAEQIEEARAKITELGG